jgi:hypothetical protein
MNLGSAKGRLKRLEARQAPCPHCSGQPIQLETVYKDDDRPGTLLPAACVHCGCVSKLIRIVKVVVPPGYQRKSNAEPSPPAGT